MRLERLICKCARDRQWIHKLDFGAPTLAAVTARGISTKPALPVGGVICVPGAVDM